MKIVAAETLPVWTKKDRKIQIKINSKILLTGRKYVKLFSSKPMLFSMKTKNEQKGRSMIS